MGQPPVKTAPQPQPLAIPDRQPPLLLHPHPAHLGQARGFEIKGLGDLPLGELDLQRQSIQQHRPRGLARAATAAHQQGHQHHHQP